MAGHLAQAGAAVTITGRRPGGAATAQRLGVRFVWLDVADKESVRAGFEVLSSSPIDCLILNAGIK